MKGSKDVLVVGDWYVDAHWVVAPHESETASRRGDMHSLAVHDLNSTVRALCGAGQVANVLSVAERGSHLGAVYGLGSWAHGDDPFIQALLEGSNEGDNPLKLKSSIEAIPQDEFAKIQRVFNLAAKGEKAGTNRVIRIYRQSTTDQYRLVERIDFEIPTPRLDLTVIDRLPQSIGSIVVKDHGRGVVTAQLIGALTKRFPHVAWYVSTKRWSVLDGADHLPHDRRRLHWINQLKDHDLRLILFQQEAAARARSNYLLFPEVGNWLVEGSVPTRSALEAIDNALDEFTAGSTQGSPVIVVLPSRESLIARVASNGHNTRALGYAYVGPVEKPYESFVPRASVLFASMFCASRIAEYQEHRKSSNSDTEPAIVALRRALDFTAIWVQEEGRRIVERSWLKNECRLHCGISGEHMIGMADGDLTKRLASVAPRSESRFNWNHVKSEYRQAFTAWPLAKDQSGFGVIESHGEHFLELWRGKSDIPGVISIVRAKRHMSRVLSHQLDQFVKSGKPRHKSFLIVDDPGGGKSTLVRKLADSKKMRLLQLNITELTRRTELLAFFDTVVTTQARDREFPVLVFVDEINALLENQPVFSAFLAPLEDGHYNRDGKSFTIEPCVWIFAGTDDLSVAAHGRQRRGSDVQSELRKFFGLPGPRPSSKYSRARQLDRSQKKSDFASRLTLPPFVLNDPFGYREPERILDTKFITAAIYAAEHVSHAETRSHIAAALKSGHDDRDPERLGRKLIADRLLRPGRALERVYIGAEMITRLHPNVERISRKVLKAFAYLPDTFSLRDLRHDLESMVNVQRGEIHWHNLPTAFHRHLGEERIVNGIVASLTDRPRKSLDELCSDIDESELVWVRPTLGSRDNRWTGIGTGKPVQESVRNAPDLPPRRRRSNNPRHRD